MDLTRFRAPRLRGVALAAGAASVLAGALGACGATGPAPAQVVASFRAALAAGDGTAACRLLAPVAREQLADDATASCETAVLSLDLPSAPPSSPATRVAGRQAQVASTDDVVFLTKDGATWAITGAGCEPRGDRPYRCAVGGG